MAGIGIKLKELSQRDTLSSMVGAFGHAAVIAAGPWLFTIASLATTSLLTERIVGLDALANFRVIIIYAFAVSLVLTAPVTMVATRLVADALWERKPEKVRPLLLGAYAVAVAAVAVGLIPLLAWLQPRGWAAVALASASMLVGLIWVVLSFCGAVRDYVGVTLSFLAGLAIAMLAAIGLAILGLGVPGMAAGFLLGLSVTFLGLTWRVLSTFPQPMRDALSGLRALRDGSRAYWRLALGALAGAAGVWIDKWIFWCSPAGEKLGIGLWHAPLYDSAMFIASLGIIPALSAFVLRLETDFFERYQHYYAVIGGHGTYDQIEAARRRLQSYTLDNLALITAIQIGICAVLALTAPLIVDALNLQFRQVAILRFGALGTVFQFVFIACSAMMLFFDRRRRYLMLQVMFLAVMAGLTLLTIHLGDDYYGAGYFVACLASGMTAYLMADRTFTNLNYLTFIGNNPSIVAAGSMQRPSIWRRLAGRRGAAVPRRQT